MSLSVIAPRLALARDQQVVEQARLAAGRRRVEARRQHLDWLLAHRELLGLRREWDEVRHSLPKLHAAQQEWAAEQVADLERHFEQVGKPESVPREWPILTADREAMAA